MSVITYPCPACRKEHELLLKFIEHFQEHQGNQPSARLVCDVCTTPIPIKKLLEANNE